MDSGVSPVANTTDPIALREGNDESKNAENAVRQISPTETVEHDADDFPGDRGALSAYLVLLGSFLSLVPSFGLMSTYTGGKGLLCS